MHLRSQENVKYLGITIDEDLNWKGHVESIRKKCLPSLANLRRLQSNISTETKKALYNTLVLPHLDYSCVVWQACGVTLAKKLDRIQNYMQSEADPI